MLDTIEAITAGIIIIVLIATSTPTATTPGRGRGAAGTCGASYTCVIVPQTVRYGGGITGDTQTARTSESSSCGATDTGGDTSGS